MSLCFFRSNPNKPSKGGTKKSKAAEAAALVTESDVGPPPMAVSSNIKGEKRANAEKSSVAKVRLKSKSPATIAMQQDAAAGGNDFSDTYSNFSVKPSTEGSQNTSKRQKQNMPVCDSPEDRLRRGVEKYLVSEPDRPTKAATTDVAYPVTVATAEKNKVSDRDNQFPSQRQSGQHSALSDSSSSAANSRPYQHFTSTTPEVDQNLQTVDFCTRKCDRFYQSSSGPTPQLSPQPISCNCKKSKCLKL
jgi:hypothetical protein